MAPVLPMTETTTTAISIQYLQTHTVNIKPLICFFKNYARKTFRLPVHYTLPPYASVPSSPFIFFRYRGKMNVGSTGYIAVFGT